MTATVEHDDPLISASAAARQLDVTSQTIRSWAKSGALSHVRLPSGVFRFRQSVIDAIAAGVSGESQPSEDGQASDQP